MGSDSEDLREEEDWMCLKMVGDCCPTGIHQTPKMTMKKSDPPSNPMQKLPHLPFIFFIAFLPKSKKAAPPMWIGKDLIFKRKSPLPPPLSLLFIPSSYTPTLSSLPHHYPFILSFFPTFSINTLVHSLVLAWLLDPLTFLPKRSHFCCKIISNHAIPEANPPHHELECCHDNLDFVLSESIPLTIILHAYIMYHNVKSSTHEQECMMGRATSSYTKGRGSLWQHLW